MKKILSIVFVVTSLLLLNGCVKKSDYDYTAFKESRPISILVMMPTNDSADIKAGYGVLSQITYPLAEAGYYVLPVVVVDEVFKQNGITVANDIQAININKLRSTFGADAALYLNVKQYGTSYQVINSDTRVTLEAKLVDIRTGRLIWEGNSTASSTEQQGNNGLLVSLVAAVINQIADTTFDKSFEIAGVATQRLLLPNPLKDDGILYGPRSTKYQNP